ncbi:UDP-N-acetylmuramate dehydrogenase [Paenibacillus segetis]|uniref:UDP-N-acetylenolpyruvoylglucosamine reductase n=1 Tax=Paenibacillus segetis TaxID=1325360 RepID=A0ABQ1YD25_9BACL|nr:UDP-N-acetylmuramate dehydrogenase [Paenibacillus segetis]GGH21572.1 UDP-N-acetylenolpyruvoylglucosamine reductase 2 [Paenibacillus segetis]
MNSESNLYKYLMEQLPSLDIKLSEPIKNHAYTKLGGEADVFITPSQYEEVSTILRIAKEEQIPVTLLGHGANLIVRDGGLRGITMNLNKMNEIRSENGTIYAQAGASIIEVSRWALDKELSGLEFACGIPGTVGGALFMNAGAYGGQISDVLVKALVMTPGGELLTLSNKDLLFGYRKSIISEQNYIVLEAEFQLQQANYATIKEKMDEFTEARESKQPLEYPSCGSVFKRPPGYFAGKLIQDCGLQGKRIGGAEVSMKHAGFIVNVDHAASQDYIDLIEVIKNTVKQQFDVDLETEVIVIGEE